MLGATITGDDIIMLTGDNVLKIPCNCDEQNIEVAIPVYVNSVKEKDLEEVWIKGRA
jgi:hypothetical protein